MEYSTLLWVITLATAYLTMVRITKYRRINEILRKYPDHTLPLRDKEIASEVLAVLRQFDFTFLLPLVNEFIGFKAVSIPSMSKIFVSTSQVRLIVESCSARLLSTPFSYQHTKKCPKRLNDETVFHSEMGEIYARRLLREQLEGRPDPEEDKIDEMRAQLAIKKINFMHSHYRIKQDDYLYTVGIFTLDVIWWVNKYGWRPMTMIEANKYERASMVYARANQVVTNSLIDVFVEPYPAFMHSFIRQALYGIMTARTRAAIGVQAPPSFPAKFFLSVIWLRSTFSKYFVLPRRTPLVKLALRANDKGVFVPRSESIRGFYPDGYHVQDVGPDKFVGKCPHTLLG
ncbi:hypothetical protein K493DRAFT_309406 [Basidiobolus meristosporus CBS 931.73]|uniref:ER-bound oxygenase mpaB/mpaB'/Rubber oxygenase catalytic domain-containing protein n=1 Tax=Basidiobolus meristosporus CBS 931.73 TaxID=1314790 RepID=A0A1Y1VWW8_9FUNG|nr:hypothetical protein K493DRAFT_309406 [Basidiobolus meristosporus CBS 931.73]|eukprot:ORX65798.1 hypothetical protein K493DRAFT_309406 [Basidiobolus meristosporus CBS 931.73]